MRLAYCYSQNGYLFTVYIQGEETREPGPAGQGAQPLQVRRPAVPGCPALPRGLPHLSRPADAQHQEAAPPPPLLQGAPGEGGGGPGHSGRLQHHQHLQLSEVVKCNVK